MLAIHHHRTILSAAAIIYAALVLQLLCVSSVYATSLRTSNTLRNDDAPANDVCESATHIDRLPYQVTGGTLQHTSLDKFSVACYPPFPPKADFEDDANDNEDEHDEVVDEVEEVVDGVEGTNFAVWRTHQHGVWYVIKNARPGTGLIVEVQGINSNVNSEVIATPTSNTNNNALCPTMFECIPGLMEASSVSSENTNAARSYQWYEMEGMNYFIYISRMNGSPVGSGYNLNVDMFDYKRTPPTENNVVDMY